MAVHIPVLLNEVLDNFSPAPGEKYIDCTAGEGGHSIAIAKLVAPNGEVLSIDWDPLEQEIFKERIEDEGLEGVITPVNGSFADLKKIAERNNFLDADGILMDLGFSSWQLEKSNRGFTFQKNEKLDMRFNPRNEEQPTAADYVNRASKETLVDIFRKYGQEHRAEQIASAIIQNRKKQSIETTGDLVNIVSGAIGGGGRINPATKVFQALRIAVNDELENINKGLEAAISIMPKDALLAVISFHSLEDRIIKYTFKDWAAEDRGEIITKKVIKPQYEETKNNPRARSAKLRLFKSYGN